ncbi:hemolysin family protein [Paenibacillus sp.]|uniref:hemolysin family protein n=1 Tax=Paenibacillus sp. TaxID=58172 RepID=UPI002D3EC9E4|nr:hemolysin family protein [Paenibacillus sp.]HZG55523.1 hemolysin family protein [Paenibacillus sp.]
MDPLPLWLGLTSIVVLVFLNGFFVAAEFAMVKVRGTRIDALVQQGHRRAAFARRLTTNLDAYLSACQLGITLASLGLGWIGEPTIAKWLETTFAGRIPDPLLHPLAFAIAFSLITILHIVLGELMPKTLAIRKSEGVTLMTALPLDLFYRIMYPFIWLLNGLAGRLLRLLGIEPASESESAHTEDEIRILVKESNKSGHIDNTELALVHNVFDFADTTAREIMIPRTEMVCLYADRPFADNMRIVIEEKHTRYPVCVEDKDNVVGMVHIKDLLEPNGATDLRPFVRPIMKVPESMPIPQLMKVLQRKRSYMALLIDEYGGTAGLVTFEDIIEELVGEVHDEFDEERPAIEKRDAETFSIDGLLLIEDVNEHFGVAIDNDVYDTIGGWMYAHVESPPRVHQKVIVGEFEFSVEETENLRVSRILVRRRRHEPVRAFGVG